MSDRRREEWAGRLQRFHENPCPVAAFCRREGVSSASFYLWKGRLVAVPPTPAFVPLTVADDAPPPPVEVVFPNGIVIRVPAGGESFRTVLALARGRRAEPPTHRQTVVRHRTG